MSKADALASDRMWRDTDVRHVLPLIQAPSLIFHHAHIHSETAEESRFVARHIPGARSVELERPDLSWAELFDHLDPFVGSLQAEEHELERDPGHRPLHRHRRLDGRRQPTSAIAAWLRPSRAQHNATVRALLGRYRGHEVDTAG